MPSNTDQTEATKQLLAAIQPRLGELATSYDPSKFPKVQRDILPSDLKKLQEKAAEKRLAKQNPEKSVIDLLKSSLYRLDTPNFLNFFRDSNFTNPKEFVDYLTATPYYQQHRNVDNYLRTILSQHPRSFTKEERDAAEKILRDKESSNLLRKYHLSEMLGQKFKKLTPSERESIADKLLSVPGLSLDQDTLDKFESYYKDKKHNRDLQTKLPADKLFDLALMFSRNPLDSVSAKDAQELYKQGIDVFDPLVSSAFSKELAPADIVAGMEGKRGEGNTQKLNRYFAYEQARKKADERGDEWREIPSVIEERVENPHEYRGERVAPFSDQTKKSFEEGEKLRTLASNVEASRKTRDADLLTKIGQIGTTKDVVDKYLPEMNENKKYFQDFYKKEADKFQKEDAYFDSPYYKQALKEAEDVYGIIRKNEDQRFKENVLPKLRGRFASVGALNSSSYQNALQRAEKEHQDRLTEQHVLMMQKARQEAMRHHEWNREHRLKGVNQFDTSLSTHTDRMFRQMQAETEQQRLDRQRLLEDEKLRQDMEARQLAHQLGQQTSLEGEGKKREDQLQKEIEARMQAHNQRPGGPPDISAVTHMLSAASGVPPQPIPMPSTYPTITPPISSSASNATLLSGTAQQLGQVLGNPYYPAAQQQIQLQQQQPTRYAAGGHVQSNNSYREMMDRYLSQLEDFNKRKEEHAGRPVPLRNPGWAGVGDVAAGIGETLGTGRSALSGWARGMQRAGERYDDYYQKQHDMSKERVAMEDLLSKHRKDVTDLQSNRERYEEEARHHKAQEALENRKFSELTAYEKAQEALENRKFSELTAYEKAQVDLGQKKLDLEAGKKKDLTEKQLKNISSSEHGLKGSMDMLAKSVLLRNLSPHVKSGPAASYDPFNWEISNSSNRLYGNLARSLALDDVKGFGGVRSNFIAKTIMDNKIGLHLGKEDNLALSRNISKGTREAAEGFVKDALRSGASEDELLEELEQKNLSARDQIAMQGLEFKETKGWSDKKYNEWLNGALADWDEQYKDIRRHVKKKTLDKGEKDDHDVSQQDQAEIDVLFSKNRAPVFERLSKEPESSYDQEFKPAPMDGSSALPPQEESYEKYVSPDAAGNLAYLPERYRLKNSASQGADEEKGWFESAADAVKDAPLRTARIVANMGVGAVSGLESIPAWAISSMTGRPAGLAPHLREASEKYLGKPEKGTAEHYINRGAEAAGEFAGMTPYGRMLNAVKGSGKFAKSLRNLGDFMGGGALTEAMAGSPASLAKGVVATVPVGAGLNYLDEEHNISPIVPLVLGAGGAFLTKGASKALKPVIRKEKEFARNIRDIVGEDNLDQVIHNIKTYETPFEGYKASTAEKAYRPGEHGASGLAAVERSIEGHMPGISKLQSERKQAVKDIHRKAYPEYDSSAKAHELIQEEWARDKELLSEAIDKAKPGKYQHLEDVGLTIGDETRNLVKTLRKERKAATEPLYEQIKKSAKLVKNPENTIRLLKELEIDGMPDAVKGNFEKLHDLAHKGRVPTAGRMEAERQSIRRRYAKAVDAQDYQDAKFYKDMMTAIEDDIAVVEPLAAQARSLYREMSEPIGKIVDSSYLGKPLKKKGDVHTYTDTQIGSEFSEGKASREKVKGLKEHVGKEGAHIESLADYASQKALHDLYNSEKGIFKHDKLKEWFDKHPGLVEANPSLKENIQELAELQKILQGKKGRKAGGSEDVFAEASKPEVFIERTLKTDDKTAVVKEMVDRLKRLGGKEGVQSYFSGVLDHMYDTLTVNDSKNITHDKFNRYMKTHGDILKENLSKEQYSIIDGMRKAIESQHFTQTAGRGTNSHTKHLDELVKKLYENDGKDWVNKIIYWASSQIPGIKTVVKLFGEDAANKFKDVRKIMGDKFTTDEAFALKILERAKEIGIDGKGQLTKSKIPFGFYGALKNRNVRVPSSSSRKEDDDD